MFFIYVYIDSSNVSITSSDIDTHDDLPLPDGPMMAFRPGIMIPLRETEV